MATVIIRKRYDKHNPEDFSFSDKTDSLTQQQFADECDVNNILAKYRATGLLTHIKHHNGNFGDFSSGEDYQETLAKVMQAQQSFDSIPSEIRYRFNNDPKLLIDFLSKEENMEEAVKLGLRAYPEQVPDLTQSFEKALENNDKKRDAKTTQKA